MHGRHQVAPLERDDQLDDSRERAEAVADGGDEQVDALAGHGAERHRALVRGPQPLGLERGQVGLVERHQLGDVVGADLGEHLAHRPHVAADVGGAGVDHVDQQVGVDRHVERRPERLHELVRQLADEADGVGEQHRLAAGQVEAAGRGVERGEQAVLDQHAGVGQAVEQRRLAGVGVPDDHDLGELAPPLRPPLGRAVAVDLAQVALELVDAAHDAPAVDLELGLTRAPGTDAGAARGRHAAGLLGERAGPAPQPRQPVAELGQLDLRLALLAVGVLGEDVEDHRGAVDGRAAEQLLEVELLGGRELVVEHDRVAVGRQRQLAQLLGLALADVGGRVGGLAPLVDAADLVGARGVDQQRQLVDRLLGVLDRLGRDGDPDEDDLLAEGPFDQRHGDAPSVISPT